MPKSVILLGLLILAQAAPAALDSADSNLQDAGLFVMVCSVLTVFVVAPIAFWRTSLAVRKGRTKPRTLALFLATVAVLWLAIYGATYRWLNPPSLKYQFSSGQSGTWFDVQFTHVVNRRHFRGPWVGGWPLSVRFPDLNRDGFPDIAVYGDGGRLVEYVYLPQNDGKCFWHLKRAEGFAVSYPPEDRP